MAGIGKTLSDAGKELLDILYPARCPICHDIAPYHQEICPECRKKLPYVNGKRCRICGKPVEDFEILCDDCQKIRHIYNEGIGVFLYDDVMRETMSYLKYKNRREYGKVLGNLVFEETEGRIKKWSPDAVVPVPLHRKKLAMRGYNQAEEIARPIAERAGIRLRTEQTAAMKNLTAKERRENLVHAFSVNPKKKVPERVLLVDDIYTTGATIDACAAALRASGAVRITFLTVCIGMGFMVRY